MGCRVRDAGCKSKSQSSSEALRMNPYKNILPMAPHAQKPLYFRPELTLLKEPQPGWSDGSTDSECVSFLVSTVSGGRWSWNSPSQQEGWQRLRAATLLRQKLDSEAVRSTVYKEENQCVNPKHLKAKSVFIFYYFLVSVCLQYTHLTVPSGRGACA